MQVQHIIGADLSKKSIDLVCHLSKTHLQIENTTAGFKQLLSWCKKQQINPEQLIVVMEYTGLYSFLFEQFLHLHKIAFTKVNALVIKRSSGLVRGKSDKLDATRIAAYGYQRRNELMQSVALCPELNRLQLLYATRERLVKHKAAFLCAIEEYRNIGIPEKDSLIHTQVLAVKAIDKQLETIQQEIMFLIDSNDCLKRNFELLQTIKGVGKVLALATIIKTANFIKFTNSRKFACFCGTAPFEHTSGSSIKGRTRVSKLADKKMKTLLDLSAKSAIQHDKELHDFYVKRTENGKSKMSTINIVRNKIIYRMFAVIKRQSPFVDNFLSAA